VTSHDTSTPSAVATLIASDRFEVLHQVVRGWHLFVVRGEIADADVDAFADVIDSGVATGARDVIVDLARASAVSAACMTRLLAIDRRLRSVDGDLRLVVDGVAVLHAIRAANLTGCFQIHRYVGDIVGAVPGLYEGGRGRRKPPFSAVTAHPRRSTS
jgi:anti-anti-sigma regulatory factor